MKLCYFPFAVGSYFVHVFLCHVLPYSMSFVGRDEIRGPLKTPAWEAIFYKAKTKAYITYIA